MPLWDAVKLRRMIDHDWPGNVREQLNAAVRAVLGSCLRAPRQASRASAVHSRSPIPPTFFERILIELELRRIRSANV